MSLASEVLAIDAEARRLERERVVGVFLTLADHFDSLAEDANVDSAIAWEEAARSVRAICDQVHY